MCLDMIALGLELLKFGSLQHLDISKNPGIQMMPCEMLRVASRLLTFKCDGCSLVLPPQRLLSSPERNPAVIQEILGGKLDLSASELTSSLASEAACFLPFFPNVSHLDLSNNPGLGGAGVVSILSSFSGDF